MSSPRPLAFPLNYALSLTSLVEEGVDSFTLPEFPADSDERTTLLLNLSLREFVALATAIDVGSDIAFGEEAVAVWWLWTRSIMSETLCQKIAECINTNESVRNAIGDIFTSDIDTPQYQQLLEKLRDDMEETISPVAPVDCNDSLWGACISFVEALNRNALDYLELLETSPIDQTLELANNVANAPLLDEAGLDAITSTISWAIDQLFDYYVASYTDEYRDALACEVFCRVKDTCAVSVNDFYEVLKARANVNVLDPNSLVQVAISLAQIVFSGASDRVVDVWFYWNLELARLGNTLANANGVAVSFGFGNAMTRLKTQLKLGFNNPDSDWQLLCEDCPPAVQAFIDVNAGTILINGNTVTGVPSLVGYRYDVADGDSVQVSISGQIGVRFNTSDPNIFNPADPLARIEITANGGGMIVYNRSSAIGTTNGIYDAGFINADNTIAFNVVLGVV